MYALDLFNIPHVKISQQFQKEPLKIKGSGTLLRITGLLLFQKNALFTGFSAIYRTKKLKKGDKKGAVLVMYSSVTICY